ncbi:hypothetical protein ABZ942_40780 [Nocardia sp. NPDC046473]|uniref:WXG100-like domain-containing protein n=1 Tax=Nocardia sp. NPDC046473 TaxID=3155733 RepID=UPI0033DD9A18
MSLHWPSDLAWLTYVVGSEWPEGDEDKMFAMAQAWLTAADAMEKQLIPALGEVHNRAVLGYQAGQGHDAISLELRKLISGDNSIDQLAKDFQQVGTSTRHAATTLEETKLMIIVAISMLAAQIIGAWLWPPTAPAVEAAAIGATRAAVYRVTNRALDLIAEIPGIGEFLVKVLRYLPKVSDGPGKIAGLVAKPVTGFAGRAAPGLTRAALDWGFTDATALAVGRMPAAVTKFMIEKAVNNVIWAGGGDLLIQEIQIAKGHRDGIDGKEVALSITASIGAWYAGALVATNVEKYGGKLLTRLGKDPTAGVWGAGLGLLSGTVPTVVATLVGAGIGELFTGTFDPRMALIGAVSANSLMGAQRGYIGMLGDAPQQFHARPESEHGSTMTGRAGSAEHIPMTERTEQTRPPSLRSMGSGSTGGRVKSYDELLQEIRQRDVPGYHAARVADREARSGGRAGEPEFDPRQHRNAFQAEQRKALNDLTTAQREVKARELELVRARAAARAPRADASPDQAGDPIVHATQRLGEAQSHAVEERSRIQRMLAGEPEPQPTGAGNRTVEATEPIDAPTDHIETTHRSTGALEITETVTYHDDASSTHSVIGELPPNAPHADNQPPDRSRPVLEIIETESYHDYASSTHSTDRADLPADPPGPQPPRLGIRSADRTITDLDRKLSTLEQRSRSLAAADERVQRTHEEIHDANSRLAGLNDRRNTLQREKDAAEANLSAAQTRLDHWRTQLDEPTVTGPARASATEEFTQAERDLKAAQHNIVRATTHLELTAQEQSRAHGKLDGPVRDQDKAVAATDKADRAAEDALDAATRAHEAQRAELDRLTARRDVNEAELQQAQREHRTAEENLAAHNRELARAEQDYRDLAARERVHKQREARAAQHDSSAEAERQKLSRQSTRNTLARRDTVDDQTRAAHLQERNERIARHERESEDLRRQNREDQPEQRRAEHRALGTRIRELEGQQERLAERAAATRTQVETAQQRLDAVDTNIRRTHRQLAGFARLHELQDQFAAQRGTIAEMRALREEQLLTTGITQAKLEAELAQIAKDGQTDRTQIERTLSDGGYFSGKPKGRKLPLNHDMPDPFSALLPPPGPGFWLTGVA